MMRPLFVSALFTTATLFVSWLAGEVHGMAGTDEWIAFAALAVLMAVVGTWAVVNEWLAR